MTLLSQTFRVNRHRRAPVIADQHLPADDVDVARLRNELGVVLKYTGGFSEAAELYAQAHAVLVARLGPAHADIAMVLHNIGGLAHVAGRLVDGEPAARSAVSVRAAALGDEHPATAADRAALAAILDGPSRRLTTRWRLTRRRRCDAMLSTGAFEARESEIRTHGSLPATAEAYASGGESLALATRDAPLPESSRWVHEGGRRAMTVVRRIGLFIAVAALAAAVAAPPVSAHDRRGAVMTRLAEFGSDDFVIGSTIGPDGALYVTDGVAGAVLRIDRRSGQVSPYAGGLPPKAFPDDTGGPIDVAFAGRTAYVLVTIVSGSIFREPVGDPEAHNGLYRIERAGANTLGAGPGKGSAENPPKPAIFIDTGVQFALEPYRGGFLVTDGHHNRVLWVSRHGSIHELVTFGNVVPTGLETAFGRVFVTQLGRSPMSPRTARSSCCAQDRSRAR